MIRVGMLTNTLETGGVEKYAIDICNRIDPERFAPALIYFGGGTEALEHLQRSETPVIRVEKRRGNDAGLPARIARACREHEIRILHSNNWGTLLEAALTRIRSRDLRWIHAQHGLEYNERLRMPRWKRWRQAIAARFALGRADGIVAVSEATRAFLSSAWWFPRSRVDVIPNGVDLPICPEPEARATKRRELGIPEAARLVVSVGRWDPVKNYPCLVEAYHQIAPTRPDLHLLLVGDGRDADRIRAAISGGGSASRRVHCPGRRDDVPELLAAADVFVLPSLSEGIPLSVLEAFAAGLPVVATEVGGLPELVDTEVGALVPPADPTAIADALGPLLDTDARRREAGEAARRRLEERFTLDRMVRAYESLYDGVSSTSASGRRARAPIFQG